MLLCIFIVLLIHFFHFQFWDCEQNLIPNMWEVVLPNIPIEGGIVHPDINWFFDGSGQVVFFSSNNVKVLHRCFMATVTLMYKYWILKDSRNIWRPHPQYLYIKVTVAMKHLWRSLTLLEKKKTTWPEPTIKESMYIRVNNPTLNRNIGKYNLPHIWDKILFTIPELKMKKMYKQYNKNVQ